jgi:TPP-dependent pyruvate/acetoin dehydrogenase alpha subunit
MARGWESKAVEELRDTASAPSDKKRPARSADEQQRIRKRDALQLARKRILGDLDSARHPRHRELLERTLAELDEQIRALGSQD